MALEYGVMRLLFGQNIFTYVNGSLIHLAEFCGERI